VLLADVVDVQVEEVGVQAIDRIASTLEVLEDEGALDHDFSASSSADAKSLIGRLPVRAPDLAAQCSTSRRLMMRAA